MYFFLLGCSTDPAEVSIEKFEGRKCREGGGGMDIITMSSYTRMFNVVCTAQMQCRFSLLMYSRNIVRMVNHKLELTNQIAKLRGESETSGKIECRNREIVDTPVVDHCRVGLGVNHEMRCRARDVTKECIIEIKIKMNVWKKCGRSCW